MKSINLEQNIRKSINVTITSLAEARETILRIIRWKKRYTYVFLVEIIDTRKIIRNGIENTKQVTNI